MEGGGNLEGNLVLALELVLKEHTWHHSLKTKKLASDGESTVLSQCNSWIVLRLTNSQDQEHVGRFLPDIPVNLCAPDIHFSTNNV